MTGDLLSSSQYALVCASVFITPFASIPNNIAHLVKPEPSFNMSGGETLRGLEVDVPVWFSDGVRH